ncbi:MULTISPECIES: isopeptide-forming domain-containing fimbrial protein [unclassified Enterococcus]|uniref:isopeptide-forming domain-containing fimbrial protein n=1 Tax=unclassified Enterococcus TaxID=2608891 RepID=UPI002476DFD9|nr:MULTISPECIES: isopeptide-forming domain-containing fimbrial protein [unclassified Enterococcus]
MAITLSQTILSGCLTNQVANAEETTAPSVGNEVVLPEDFPSEVNLLDDNSNEELTVLEEESNQIYQKAIAENYIASSEMQQDTATVAYYTAKGATPATVLETVEVANWGEFRAAYENENVEKIKLIADIYQTGGLSWSYERKNSLEIDGAYLASDGNQKRHILSLYDVMLRTSTNVSGFQETLEDGTLINRSIFYMHDVSIAQNGDRVESIGRYAFIGDEDFHSNITATNPSKANSTRNWYFRFGNIDTDTDENTEAKNHGMGRLLIGYQAEVTLYGEIRLSTTAENFYLGSLILEDGTNYHGTVEYSNYSIVWFVTNSVATDTGAKKEMILGKNSNLYLHNVRDSADYYPAVFGWYQNAVIGEGATFSSNMPGNAWRFDFDGHLTVEKDATMNLLSRGDGAVVQYGSRLGAILASNRRITASINVKPGGSFYVFGNTGETGLGSASVYFGASSTSDNAQASSLILDNPKAFDIRNTGGNRAIDLRGYNNYLQIINSDIDLWYSSVNCTDPSSESVTKQNNLKITATGSGTGINQNLQVETSSASFPAGESLSTYRRLAGLNSTPTTIWKEYYTDADLEFTARVKLGDTPIGYNQSTGAVITEPIYASTKSDVSTTITDTHGDVVTLKPDDQGYVSFSDTVFQTAGKNISGQSIRGPEDSHWVEEPLAITEILDVTPPEPLQLTNGKVTNLTKKLSATGVEAGASVYLSIDESSSLIAAGTVTSDGSWQFELTDYLAAGQTVRIYLDDNSGSLPADFVISEDLSDTRSATGNRNFVKATTYRDAEFKAAPIYVVEDVKPTLNVSKTVVSSGGDTTSVGDTLTYTIEVTNNQVTTVESILKNIKVVDSLPSQLTIDLTSIKLNGEKLKAEQFEYQPATGKLTVDISDLAGDLNSGEKAVLTFATLVEKSAYNQIITNTVKAEAENLANEKLSATASVESPGGEVLGTVMLLSAPASIDFGEIKYQGKEVLVNNPTITGEALEVSDTRGVSGQTKWEIKATVSQPLTSTTDVLTNALHYQYGNQNLQLSEAAQIVYSKDSGGDQDISSQWSETGDGPKLAITAAEASKLGNYNGTITWTLEISP